MRTALVILVLALTLAFIASGADAAAGSPKPIALIKLQGAIDVPSAEYLERGLRVAEQQHAQCLLILLNTPGGLGQPMKDMTEDLLNARLPTIVYVYPAGAYAMSAGTFVTLAANIAAMHPASSIGAAHPVELFPIPTPPEPEGEKPKEPGKPAAKKPPSADVMTEKMVNAFASQARVIAEARGRNADWAEKAVRESVSVPADEAVRLRVVDFIATDEATLLAKLDGFRMAGRQGQVLRLNGARLVLIEEGLRSKVLRTLSDPNLAYLLFMIGLAGLYFEFSTPGAILPGVVGAICLILAFFALQTIPVSYAGVALIVLAVILFIAEIKVISHGVLALGGAVALILGSLMLFDTPELYMRVSLAVILPAAVAFSLFFALVVRLAVRAHRAKPLTGERGIVGETGRVTEAVGPQGGKVFVHGEYWNAVSEAPIEAGVKVRVVAVEELTLKVERV